MRKSLLTVLLLLCSLPGLKAQTVMIPGAWPTWGSCYPPPPALDAMHLLYNPAGGGLCQIEDAAMRITWGTAWSDPIFAQLAVVDSNHTYLGSAGRWFSAVAPNRSTVLRSSWGDLVLSATTAKPPPTWGGTFDASIRFGTTPNDSAIDAEHPKDFERMTIWHDGKLGVGTHGVRPASIYGDSGHAGEYDLLHLHVPCIPATYNVDQSQGYAANQLSALKISYGLLQDPQLRFAELGFDRGHQFSSLSNNEDLVLATNSNNTLGLTSGDMIISNRRLDRSIRFATTNHDDNFPKPEMDVERLTIAANGNVGIDLPTNSGPASPLDQIQIGGAVAPYPGNAYPTPGLTIYGGSALENTSRPGGGTYPGDWRYIAFNHYVDHTDPGSDRGYRSQPNGGSQIGFAEADGGTIDLSTSPFNESMSHDSAMHDFTGGVSMHITSAGGLFVWSDESKRGGGNYHHLLDLFRPGVTPWPVSRNTNGLLVHHTPVLITSDSTSTPSLDFQNLPVHPNLGDDTTWLLAVNGPALFKEAFVSLDWPDYVFDKGYELMPLDRVENYIAQHHHLPGVPSADSLAKTGVPLGQTEAQMMQKIEEQQLYIIEMSKQLEALRQEVEEMRKRGEK